jgi:Na/Pi-cotransporter
MFDTIFLAASGVILFLYGLEHFGQEIHRLGVNHLKGALERFAGNRWRGFALGAIMTAILQSSSALSALTVALVNSGVISFRNSLAILIGANVGTTLTAQIVALKLTGIGPIFIVLGTVLSLIKIKASVVGKTVFYFGFIFFSLDLISNSLAPLGENPQVVSLLAEAQNPVLGVLMGALVTLLLQSSSVSTGLVVLLVQQRALGLDAAIPLILGANLGTTGTALLASMGMERAAKRAAIGNAIFNFLGVLLVFPVLSYFTTFLMGLDSRPSQLVANAHLFFNLGVSLIFILFLKPYERFLLRIFP